jgi:hypothetical protein
MVRSLLMAHLKLTRLYSGYGFAHWDRKRNGSGRLRSARNSWFNLGAHIRI